MMFVKYFKLYLPTGWEVSKYPVFFEFTANPWCMVWLCSL